MMKYFAQSRMRSIAILFGVVCATGALAQQQPAQIATQRPAGALDSTVWDTASHSRSITTEQMSAAGYVVGAASYLASISPMYPYIGGHLTVRRDSLLLVVDSMVRAWVMALHSQPIPQRQLLNMAALHLRIHQDDEAQKRIAEWLSLRGATIRDTLNAYGLAVELLTQHEPQVPVSSDRFALAQHYVRRLEALPVGVAAETIFRARMTLMREYSDAGIVDSVVAIGLRAYTGIPKMPSYQARAAAASNDGIKTLALVLSGQSHGRQRIDSLFALLKTYIPVPADSLARDTALARFSSGAGQGLAANEQWASLFGRPMPPFVATHWINQPTPAQDASNIVPGARILALDDGIIRIIGFGWFSCGFCQGALAKLQKEQPSLPPGVKTMYYEWTEGNWGRDFVEPDTEVVRLRHFMLDLKHYTFPVAIWAGPKDSTGDGGLLPRVSPLKTALLVRAGPTFFLVDGHGLIRYRQEGYQSYDHDFRQLVQLLIREREHHPATTASTPPQHQESTL